MSERQRLIAGYLKRMRADSSKNCRQVQPDTSEIKRIPHTVMISGFETALSPERIFETAPGELLQHYEMGALVAPYDSKRSLDPYSTLAKLEYAIDELKIQHLVVLGNTASECLSYLIDGTEHPALSGWIEIAHNAIARARHKAGSKSGDHLKREILHQTVLQSVRNLLTYPVVHHAVKRGELVLNAWYYKPDEDELYAYNPDNTVFEKICFNADLDSVNKDNTDIAVSR